MASQEVHDLRQKVIAQEQKIFTLLDMIERLREQNGTTESEDVPKVSEPVDAGDGDD